MLLYSCNFSIDVKVSIQLVVKEKISVYQMNVEKISVYQINENTGYLSDLEIEEHFLNTTPNTLIIKDVLISYITL